MNIMVFDVPAEYGGALSILIEFYNDVRKHSDKSINWIFVLSKPELEETENIKILRFPWIKKSWGHRLYFDQVVAPRIVKKYKSDKILSLQNVVVPRTKVSQTVYIHQSLPFIDYKFSFNENRLFWIYQNVIGKNIIKSIKRADKVVVQTKWFRDACIEKTGVERKKISIVPPNINIDIKTFFNNDNNSASFFIYPAGSSFYKNHRLIVEACKILKERSFEDFKIFLTLNGNENRHIKNLYNEIEKSQLPIEFIGSIPRDQVFDYYTKSALIFPSYIETFGLPMLEAKLHKGVIIASDCPFSHEILDEYEDAYFFDPFAPLELANLIEKIVLGIIVKKGEEIIGIGKTNHIRNTIDIIIDR